MTATPTPATTPEPPKRQLRQLKRVEAALFAAATNETQVRQNALLAKGWPAAEKGLRAWIAAREQATLCLIDYLKVRSEIGA